MAIKFLNLDLLLTSSQVSPVKPKVTKHIHAVSDSPISSVSRSAAKRPRTNGHGCKPTTGHAIMSVSISLDRVAEALALNPGGPSSPQRKTEAVKKVSRSACFSHEEKIEIFCLICSDTSVADTFLGITLMMQDWQRIS